MCSRDPGDPQPGGIPTEELLLTHSPALQKVQGVGGLSLLTHCSEGKFHFRFTGVIYQSWNCRVSLNSCEKMRLNRQVQIPRAATLPVCLSIPMENRDFPSLQLPGRRL